jgi:hypothetical protein
MKSTPAAFLLVAVAACHGPTLDLGEGDEAGRPIVSPGDDGGSCGDSRLRGTGVASFEGTWSGYAQTFQLPSGSDALTLVFKQQGDGTLAGTLTFGTRPAPPPATDRDASYPPSQGQNPLNLASIEGVPYSTLHANVSPNGTRLQFDINTLELWQGWCALQTPHSVVTGFTGSGTLTAYECGPSGPYNSYEMGRDGGCWWYDDSSPDPSFVSDAGTVPVACGMAVLCTQQVCTCTATSCDIDMCQTNVHFDLQLTGSTLQGSAATTPGFANIAPSLDGHTIILTHAP